MMRSKLAVLAMCLTALTRAADVPTFSTTVKLVKTDAYVYDRQTRAPIVDLEASDFTIYDEDQAREIAYFADDARWTFFSCSTSAAPCGNSCPK